ncbi:MAG: ATP-binding protein [Gemmatimonadota bacterium]
MGKQPKGWGMATLLAIPILHPFLLPMVGVASHLLWWVHVLPVALLTLHHGRKAAVGVPLLSMALLVAGERLFGAGYWVAADWQTTFSLAVALLFTNALVAGFSLYARQLTRRYRILFKRADVGIVRTDRSDAIMEMNPAATRLLGLDDSDIGKRFHELAGLEGLPPFETMDSAGGWNGRVEVLGGDGKNRGVYLGVAALRQEDPPGRQILLMDRTLEQAQQAELDRQARLATLGEGLAGVAHELRNPLSVILAYAEMAKDEDDENERRAMLDDIHSHANRIQELATELLGYSRPETDAECTDLGELLARKLRLARLTWGSSVKWVDAVGFKGSVPVPPGRVDQIVTNLLANAADALKPGGGGTVELRAWAEGGAVMVEVADDGPGVDPALGETIFQPFVTGKADSGGTGLGLAISRRLARAMGGDLLMRNGADGGAVFTLVLPDSVSPQGVPQENPEALPQSIEGVETG